MRESRPQFCCDTGGRSGGQVHDKGCPELARYGSAMWDGTARRWVEDETSRCLRIVRRWLNTEHPAIYTIIETEILNKRTQ